MTIIRTVLKALTLNCHHSSRLVSDSMERELDKPEVIATRVHMLTCTGCKRMRRQFHLMHRAHQPSASRGSTPRARLSPDARARISRRLDEEKNF